MYRIIQKRNLFFIISAVIIIPGIIAMFMGGLKLGIDFTGGSLVQISFNDTRPSPQELQDSLASLDLGAMLIQPLGASEMTIRLKSIENDTYKSLIQRIKDSYGAIEEKSFETIGPTFGQELKSKAVTATVLVLIFILIYISFAFRKAGHGPVKSWTFGAGAVIALIHDILLVVGFFAILGKYWNVEIDTLFITALLTVLGFSVHDTIVVYDRIRERLRLSYNRTFEDVVNESVNQTLVRSLNTSLTTLLVLLALFLFGGESIKYFILALLVGITAGTYSSIFVASPLLVVWNNFASKRR